MPVVQGGTRAVPARRRAQDRAPDARPPRGGRRQVAARGLRRPCSGIDLNRAGTPLLEIVTEPDMRSAAEAVEYAQALHTLVVWLGICDGNMQEGSFRCDANVSVRKPGAPVRHAARDQEPELVPLPAAGDRLRGAVADRPARRRLAHPAGDRAVRPRQRRDARDAHQGRRARLPLLPRPRPAAAGDRAGVDRARAKQRCPSCRRRWPSASCATTACRPYDAAMMTQSLGVRALLRGGARRVRTAQAGGQLADGRGVAAPERRAAGHRAVPGRAVGARRADRAHRRRHDLQQRARARCSTRCGTAKAPTSTR